MYVFLGRFSPLHLGHQKIIDKMISLYGIENCLLLIGSSNVINERTPYSFSFRKKLIKTIYPKINILPLIDVNDDHLWLDIVKKLETKLKTEFIFLGGSDRDLKQRWSKFKTKVLVNRDTEGMGISATEVRNLLEEGKFKELEKFLDPKILKLLQKIIKK